MCLLVQWVFFGTLGGFFENGWLLGQIGGCWTSGGFLENQWIRLELVPYWRIVVFSENVWLLGECVASYRFALFWDNGWDIDKWVGFFGNSILSWLRERIIWFTFIRIIIL